MSAIRRIPFLVLAGLLAGTIAASARALPERLAILAPLVGHTWRGEIRDPARGTMVATEQTYEPLGDGSVVRVVTAAPALGARTEGFFYWDHEAGAIGTFAIDERGIFVRGTVTMRDSLLTVSGRITFPERAFDFRNTFEFTAPGHLVDRWYQNAFGDWRAGHVVELTAVTP